ncbi:uncharacterized protein Bfra_004598 [Botrytis fragariae]|uniref:Uncharacterized protein n=1 Tax=Botrytis fragariae TaxID=1964551 RepID=A0A8H6AVW7_9HELO|nr:uncharacterized protein Bfra_004598 [Botrytis fragariae]KAF5874587.1 hypothetical protein Bfra_004598 [Botrytis fragariae]
MEYFRITPSNRPNRGTIQNNLQRRLQALLESLRPQYATYGNRIRELQEELSTLSAGGGRMQVIRDNLAEEICAEINVLSRQQQSLATSIDTVVGWCAELQGTGQA